MGSKWIVCAAVLGVIACGNDSRGRSGTLSTDSQVYCPAYEDMCQYDELQECHDRCDGVDVGSRESCWFKACAVATGYCDNEVDGDPQILACADAQGWYDACGRLASDCDRCSEPDNISTCNATAERGIAIDCANLRWSLSEIPTGC